MEMFLTLSFLFTLATALNPFLPELQIGSVNGKHKQSSSVLLAHRDL